MTEKRYAAQYSAMFQDQLLELSVYGRQRVLDCISLLRTMPGLGRAYDPEYEVDKPPIACQCLTVPKTTKTLFFTVDEDAHLLRFFLLRDARQDPTNRFAGVRSDR